MRAKRERLAGDVPAVQPVQRAAEVVHQDRFATRDADGGGERRFQVLEKLPGACLGGLRVQIVGQCLKQLPGLLLRPLPE